MQWGSRCMVHGLAGSCAWSRRDWVEHDSRRGRSSGEGVTSVVHGTRGMLRAAAHRVTFTSQRRSRK